MMFYLTFTHIVILKRCHHLLWNADRYRPSVPAAVAVSDQLKPLSSIFGRKINLPSQNGDVPNGMVNFEYTYRTVVRVGASPGAS